MVSILNKNGYATAEKFILALKKLGGAEICGIARILGVVTDYEDSDGNRQLREGTDVVSDMVNVYLNLDRQKRRRLMKLIKQAGEK